MSAVCNRMDKSAVLVQLECPHEGAVCFDHGASSAAVGAAFDKHAKQQTCER